MTMNRPMLIEELLHIKAYEVDAMGIVSNIVYVKWFEDLRHVFLERFYPYTTMMKEGISPMLMKTEVAYRIPLTLFDKPAGRLWVAQMGSSKWEMEFEIATGDQIHCTGKQTGCMYDLNKKGPGRIPQQLVVLFKEACERCAV